jgi:HPt (histidine-containing phosphotransfer) domain-containing protein
MALDQAALNELRALDPEGAAGLVAQIITSYLSDAPNLIQQIRTALAGNDIVSLTRHAHSLKSTSLSLGASRVSQIARELELAGKNNATDGCQSLLMALGAEYSAAERLLRAECDAARRPK